MKAFGSFLFPPQLEVDIFDFKLSHAVELSSMMYCYGTYHFSFLPLTDISLLDHAKTESITNYNTNSKLGAGVSRKGTMAQRLIQNNSKQGAVVSSKDEKALRV